jgi:hypothetical protein
MGWNTPVERSKNVLKVTLLAWEGKAFNQPLLLNFSGKRALSMDCQMSFEGEYVRHFVSPKPEKCGLIQPMSLN